MDKSQILDRLNSVKLCLMAHPDNTEDSEFADRIDDLEEIEKELSMCDIKPLKEGVVCSSCNNLGWISNEDGSRRICPCHY